MILQIEELLSQRRYNYSELNSKNIENKYKTTNIIYK